MIIGRAPALIFLTLNDQQVGKDSSMVGNRQ
jgi:hypothetical protein